MEPKWVSSPWCGLAMDEVPVGGLNTGQAASIRHFRSELSVPADLWQGSSRNAV
jgi:hypothetical protein